MSRIIYIRDGKTKAPFGVVSYLMDGDNAHIAIPVNSIEAMTDQEIIAKIRELAPLAKCCAVVEWCETGGNPSDHDCEDYLYWIGSLRYALSTGLLDEQRTDLVNRKLTGIMDELVMSAKPTSRKAKITDSSRNGPGYIYLLYGKGTPWYKLGFSIRPDARAMSIGTKSPFKIEIVAVNYVENMLDAETCLHTHFTDKRAEGEWFTLSPDDIDLFAYRFSEVYQGQLL